MPNSVDVHPSAAHLHNKIGFSGTVSATLYLWKATEAQYALITNHCAIVLLCIVAIIDCWEKVRLCLCNQSKHYVQTFVMPRSKSNQKTKNLKTAIRRVTTVVKNNIKPNHNNNNRKQKRRQKKRNGDVSFGMSVSFAPVAEATKIVSMEPVVRHIKHKGSNGIVVHNRELVLSGITCGASSFALCNFLQCNPGIPYHFPWLSSIAQSWRQYRLLQMRYIFVSSSATSAPGDILLSPEYNSSMYAPTSETMAANKHTATQNNVWSHFECVIDAKRAMGLGPDKYVRVGTIGGDINLYDTHTLSICGVNTSAAPPGGYGKVYCEYVYMFHDSITTPMGSLTGSRQTTVNLATTNFTATLTNIGLLAFDGADGLFLQWVPNQQTAFPTGGNTIYLYPGEYRIKANAVISFTAATTPCGGYFSIQLYQGGAYVTQTFQTFYVGSGSTHYSSMLLDEVISIAAPVTTNNYIYVQVSYTVTIGSMSTATLQGGASNIEISPA